MGNFKITAAISASVATIASLSACNPQAEPTPAPTPDAAQLNAFVNKLDADRKAEEDSIIANNSREAAERASESETRLKNYSDERRKPVGKPE